NEIYEVMHFEKPSYKSEAKSKDEEIMEQFDYEYKPNPKYNGLCIW
ncbi:transcriptional regulator, partial [Helicobacter pylori]|nr:transcriptional regulator [Helicobacter pylori]